MRIEGPRWTNVRFSSTMMYMMPNEWSLFHRKRLSTKLPRPWYPSGTIWARTTMLKRNMTNCCCWMKDLYQSAEFKNAGSGTAMVTLRSRMLLSQLDISTIILILVIQYIQRTRKNWDWRGERRSFNYEWTFKWSPRYWHCVWLSCSPSNEDSL